MNSTKSYGQSWKYFLKLILVKNSTFTIFYRFQDNSPAHKVITDTIFAARGRPDEPKEVAMEVDVPEIDKDQNFNTEEVPGKSIFDCFLEMDSKKPKRPRFYGQVMGRE